MWCAGVQDVISAAGAGSVRYNELHGGARRPHVVKDRFRWFGDVCWSSERIADLIALKFSPEPLPEQNRRRRSVGETGWIVAASQQRLLSGTVWIIFAAIAAESHRFHVTDWMDSGVSRVSSPFTSYRYRVALRPSVKARRKASRGGLRSHQVRKTILIGGKLALRVEEGSKRGLIDIRYVWCRKGAISDLECRRCVALNEERTTVSLTGRSR